MKTTINESVLNSMILESIKKYLREYFEFNGDDSQDAKKKREEDEMWKMHGNVNRLEHDSDMEDLGEHPGIAAQHKHDCFNRSVARGFHDSTKSGGFEGAMKYVSKRLKK